MSRSSSQSRWKSSSFRNTDGRKKNDEEMMMKILSLGGDDEETTTATNEGGKQRREDRHQHLCLQHWHPEVIEMRWWSWWWSCPSTSFGDEDDHCVVVGHCLISHPRSCVISCLSPIPWMISCLPRRTKNDIRIFSAPRIFFRTNNDQRIFFQPQVASQHVEDTHKRTQSPGKAGYTDISTTRVTHLWTPPPASDCPHGW